MSVRQRSVLLALADGAPHTVAHVAAVTDASMAVAQHTLDALYRRSLVAITDTGRYIITTRGQRKVTA
jgi:hypothetical protein